MSLPAMTSKWPRKVVLEPGTGSAGLLVGETLAAGLVHGRRLWFGTARNVGTLLAEIADDLGISIHVSEPDTGR